MCASNSGLKNFGSNIETGLKAPFTLADTLGRQARKITKGPKQGRLAPLPSLVTNAAPRQLASQAPVSVRSASNPLQ